MRKEHNNNYSIIDKLIDEGKIFVDPCPLISPLDKILSIFEKIFGK